MWAGQDARGEREDRVLAKLPPSFPKASSLFPSCALPHAVLTYSVISTQHRLL